MVDGEVAFGCCFCGEAIEEPLVPMPILLAWGDPDSDEWQEWWCHLECFIEKLHPSARHFAWDDEELTI